MLHPFGVALPTIYRLEVFIGRFPSMILNSFSLSHPVMAEANINAAAAENIFVIFMTISLFVFICYIPDSDSGQDLHPAQDALSGKSLCACLHQVSCPTMFRNRIPRDG